MSEGDLSALLTLLAIPVGGLIAWAILWLSVRVWRADGGSARLSVSASSHSAGQDENSNLAGSEHAAKAGSGENE